MAIPTPLMVDADDLEKIHADIAAKRAEVSPVVESSRSRGLVLGAALLVMIGGFAWWRARSEPAPTAQPVHASPPVSAVVVASAEPTASSPPVASALPERPVSTSSPKGSPSKAEAAPVVGKASVTFLGDPGTRVVIDGSARGLCPVRAALPEGTHDVRFTFDPTGESRGERLTVKSGEDVTVRAEFTRATPTIKIQR